jgi:hypothetical protein
VLNISSELLSPREFRDRTGWTMQRMSDNSSIPLYSLYNYMKDKEDPKYREPKAFVCRLFAVLYHLDNLES